MIPQTLDHWIDNAPYPQQTPMIAVSNPVNNAQISQVPLASASIVNHAVESAHKAFQSWSKQTFKTRALIMNAFHSIVVRERETIAKLIVIEHGKTLGEARAEVDKGCETIIYAASLPLICQGDIMQVSRLFY
jgi:malonate-semialdehyde dehydrogenase (acetylating) / methylmalonate-semialdehyde dehydrogenase